MGSGATRFPLLYLVEDVLEKIFLLIAICIFVAVAYSDVKTLRIPNMLVVAVTALGVSRLMVIGDLNIALHTVAASVVVFIAAFLLFWRGFVGGGDAKLIPATVLLVGYHDLFNFFLLMAICGAVVSLAVLFIHHYLPICLGPRLAVLLPKARLAVPYGVAIASSGIVTLLFQSSFLG
jgi:prepilin peptidase CpaA